MDRCAPLLRPHGASSMLDVRRFVVAVWVSLGTSAPAFGQAFVGYGEQYATLEQALATREIDIVLRTGQHTGGGIVSVDGTTITGEAGAVLAGVGGAYLAQLEVVANNVTIQDLEFDGAGPAQWAVVATAADGLTLRRVDIHDAVVNGAYSGAAVLLQLGSVVTIEQSVFSNNQSPEGGAVLVAGGSSATVVDSDFIGNRSTDGGFGFSGDGGAILVVELGSLEVTDCTFGANVAEGDGGAIAVGLGESVTLTQVELSDNEGFGTVAFGLVPDAVVSGATFDDNAAGGLIATDVQDLEVSDSWFCGGSGVTQGMFVTRSCDLGCTVSDSVFVGHDPGAMRLEDNLGGVTVRDTMLLGNTGPLGSAIRGNMTNLSLERLLVGNNSGGPALFAELGVNSLVDVNVFDNDPANVGGQFVNGSVVEIVAPPLTADANRCSTEPVELACDPGNFDLFVRGIGPAFIDGDNDGVPARCDCDDDDATLGWDPCDPDTPTTGGTPTEPPATTGTTEPPSTTGTGLEPPGPDPNPASFLLGGGGCGCALEGSPWAWGAVVGGLSRRR